MKRRVTIQTPLGDALKFHRPVGREALSQTQAFDIDLLGSTNALDPKALIGKAATLAHHGSRRCFEEGVAVPVIEGSSFGDSNW
jgi:uncharacterized protein involved in type VI secretion and phage assembly